MRNRLDEILQQREYEPENALGDYQKMMIEEHKHEEFFANYIPKKDEKMSKTKPKQKKA